LLALLAVVVAMNVRDPTKLQLGEGSGREFLDYQQVTRGDSIAGEYVESVPSAAVNPLPSIEAASSESPDDVEGSENE
jgi:hypothetical protein